MSFLSFSFMLPGLAAGLCAGTALSLVGVFSATRGVAFSGLAAAQMAALGAVVGSLFGWHLGASALAFGFVVAGMMGLSALARSRRTPPDAWVAALYVLSTGVAVLVLAKHPGGESETMGVLFGNILGLGWVEIWESLALLVGTAGALLFWAHRWVWIGVDAVSAEVAGIRVRLWTMVSQVLFAAAITLAIHLFGVLLAFAYLVLPATAGLVTARRLKTLFVTAGVTSAAATVLGFELSFRLDFPTGPFVAALLAAVAFGARFLGGRSRD